MDEKQRHVCRYLRELESAQAADWLMQQYPTSADNWGEALIAMAHRSWEKPDQVRLARYYLAKIPHASALAYEAFASFMSVPTLIAVIKDQIPSSPEDRGLLEYHLVPVLRRKAFSDGDLAALRGLMDALS